MQFEKFEVGQPYKPGTTKYGEGTRFDFLQSGAILELYFSRPSIDEIEDIKAGRFEIGLCERGNIIFMLFRFGNWQWMDAPYTVHLPQPFTFEDPKPGTGYGLSIFLVDAATGILEGMRYVALSTDFSRKFRDAVERQKSKPFDHDAYNMELQQVYSNYSTEDLVKRADAFCRIK
jgi:hypothetical protein